MNAIYDVWKFIDYADDSLEQARLEHLAQQIRSDMKASDFIQEIEESASFDTNCIKAVQMMFIGADPKSCAKVLSDYADAWLDRHAMKLAQSYSKC
jgi:hypothetical protein